MQTICIALHSILFHVSIHQLQCTPILLALSRGVSMHGSLLHMFCPGAMVSKAPAVCVAYVTAGVSNSLLLRFKVRLSER